VYERRRNIVVRRDGRRVNVARFRGQLFVCATGCCCGRTEDGFAPAPTETFHREWERRRLRNVIHLTIGGCLGPCALANVVLLLFDGQTQWFHSIDSEAQALALYDHVEGMLEADGCLPPPAALAPYHFTASAWQPRPDGQPVDDARLWRTVRGHACEAPASGVTADGRLTARQSEIQFNGGAYSDASAMTVVKTGYRITGPYRWAAVATHPPDPPVDLRESLRRPGRRD